MRYRLVRAGIFVSHLIRDLDFTGKEIPVPLLGSMAELMHVFSSLLRPQV